MNKHLINTVNPEHLLTNFNQRDHSSFGDMYELLFGELCHFSKRIYQDNKVDVRDIIQDIFVKIWDNPSLQFDTVGHLKSFIHTAIANNFKNLFKKSSYSDKFIQDKQKEERDDLWYEVQAIEAEVLSLLPQVIGMLPEDCAESFRLYLEGYKVREIADMLGKPLTTIYSQKQKAINILKTKLPNDKLFALILILLS